MKRISFALTAVALLTLVAPAGAVDLVPKGVFGMWWDLPTAGTWSCAYSDTGTLDNYDAIGGGAVLTMGVWRHWEWRLDLTNSTAEFYDHGVRTSGAAQPFGNGAPVDFGLIIAQGLQGNDLPFEKSWYLDNLKIVKDDSTIYNDTFQTYAADSMILGQGDWAALPSNLPEDKWYVRNAPGGTKALEVTDKYMQDTGNWYSGLGITFPAFAGDFTTGTMSMSMDFYVPNFGPEYHPGDANGDGIVDLQDFGLLKDNFGITQGATWAQGDFTGDGAIDLQDFGILKDHFGHTAGDNPVTAVPEPASLSLLALGGLALLRRRK